MVETLYLPGVKGFQPLRNPLTSVAVSKVNRTLLPPQGGPTSPLPAPPQREGR